MGKAVFFILMLLLLVFLSEGMMVGQTVICFYILVSAVYVGECIEDKKKG